MINEQFSSNFFSSSNKDKTSNANFETNGWIQTSGGWSVGDWGTRTYKNGWNANTKEVYWGDEGTGVGISGGKLNLVVITLGGQNGINASPAWQSLNDTSYSNPYGYTYAYAQLPEISADTLTFEYSLGTADSYLPGGDPAPKAYAYFDNKNGRQKVELVGSGKANLDLDPEVKTRVFLELGAQLGRYSYSLSKGSLVIDNVVSIDAPPAYSLTPSSTSINEGSALTTSVATTNVASGTTLYWSVGGTGINTSDFSAGALTGSGVVGTDGKFNFTHTLANDLTTDGDETLQIKLFTDSARTVQVGSTATVTVKDTSLTPAPTFAVTPSSISFNEGAMLTTTVATTNVASGTTLYWSIAGTGVTAADFSSGALTGSGVVGTDGKFSFAHMAANDLTTEGDETLQIKLFADSALTIQVGSTATVTVKDTSLIPAPTYGVTPLSSSINEGATLTTTVATTNVASGTTLYWSIAGTGVTAADFSSGALTGSGVVGTDGKFSFAHMAANDLTTEGDETLQIKLFSDSARTVQVGSTATVTVKDTPTTPDASLPIVNSLRLGYDKTSNSFLIAIGASDTGSGIARIEYGITNPQRVQTSGMQPALNTNTGLYEAAYPLPEQVPDGLWTLSQIWIWDKAGNSRLYRGDTYVDKVSAIPTAGILLVDRYPEAPTDLILTSSGIQENSAAATVIGTLAGVDPDAAASFTYALVTGNGINDADNVLVDIVGNEVRVKSGALIDFETNPVLNLNIRVTDNGTPGLTFTKAVTAAVLNVNEAPTDLVFTSSGVQENSAASTLIGTLSSIAPDAAASFTYALVTGNGINDADNALVDIVGNEVRVKSGAVIDFETNPLLNLNIQVTDNGNPGLTFTKAVSASVLNVNEAPTQKIYTEKSEISYKPTSIASLPLLYTTSSGDANLSGLTLNVHYNSSILTPSGPNNGVSAQVSAAISSTTILADTNNLDNDPLTDKIVQLLWATFDNSFPNRTLPGSLATVSFSTSSTKTDALTGQPLSTTVRYTASETASGYDFITGSTLFKAQQFNLDVDGDGKVTALGDGLMVIRKLFGSAFAGDALTNKAISPNATRTTAEINDFIQGGIDGGLLDVDKDGKTTALGDGLMVIRRLFGAAFDGAALTNKAIAPNSPYFGQATDFNSVGINIDALKPTLI